jgi:hypothetical protein
VKVPAVHRLPALEGLRKVDGEDVANHRSDTVGAAYGRRRRATLDRREWEGNELVHCAAAAPLASRAEVRPSAQRARDGEA